VGKEVRFIFQGRDGLEKSLEDEKEITKRRVPGETLQKNRLTIRMWGQSYLGLITVAREKRLMKRGKRFARAKTDPETKALGRPERSERRQNARPDARNAMGDGNKGCKGQQGPGGSRGK